MNSYGTEHIVRERMRERLRQATSERLLAEIAAAKRAAPGAPASSWRSRLAAALTRRLGRVVEAF